MSISRYRENRPVPRIHVGDAGTDPHDRLLKVGGAALLCALMLHEATPTGTGWKVFAAMGALIPATLWFDLAGLRTRRRSRLRLEVLVPSLFLVLSAGPLLWALFRALWGESVNVLAGFAQSLGVLIVVQPFALSSWVLVLILGRLRRRLLATPARTAASIARGLPRRERRRPPGAASPAAVRALRRARGFVGARPSAAHPRVAPDGEGGYCLHCFAPMPRIRGASERCESCGRTTLKVDLETYWTRHPRYLRIERGLKAVALVAGLSAAWVQAVSDARFLADTLWLGPFGITVVPAACFVCWDLSGWITRRRSAFRLERLLPIVVGSFGFMTVLLGRAVDDGVGLPWSFGIPFLLATPFVHIAVRAFDDWRAGSLERGLAEARARAGGSS